MSISKRGITKNKDIVQKDNSSLNHVNITKEESNILLENTRESEIDLIYKGQIEQILLPDSYQQLTYIESTGTQYIDTGVKPTSLTKIKVKASTKGENSKTGLFGSRKEYGVTSYLSFIEVNGQYIRTDIGAVQGGHTHITWYEDVIFDIEIDAKNEIILVNNNVCFQDFTFNGNDYNMYLFSVNQSNSPIYNIAGRIYRFQIYEDDILIRDFIPCYRKNDDIVGMYDIIEDTFYTNNGSGTFVKGSNASLILKTTDGIQKIIIQNKNKTNVNNINLGKTLNNDGSLTNSANRATLFKNSIEPNTQCTLSINNNYQIGNLFYYKKDKSFLTLISSNWANNKVITTPIDAYYISFATRKTDDATMTESDVENLQIQIEEGSIISSYIKSQEQYKIIDGNKLGIYSNNDYIYKLKEKYYRHITLKKIELNIDDMNNSEDFPGWNNKDELTEIKGYYDGINQNLNSLLDEWYYNFHLNNGGIGLNTLSTNKILFLYKSTFDNLTQTQFKEKYAGLTLELYYSLPEPEEEEITDTELLADLNDVLKSYNEQTNISVEADLPLIIKATTSSIYKKLEYIKGTGSQYINIGYIPKTNTKIVLDFESTDTGTGKWLIGSRTAYQSTDSLGIHWGNSNTYSIVSPASRDIVTNASGRHLLELTNTTFKVDGITKLTYSNTLANGTYPMYIFTINSGGAIDGRIGIGNLYSCKIYEDNTLVKDLIPVMRTTDNIIGLYDNITETFYENIGTGSFTGKELNLASRIDSNDILYANDFYEV